MQIIALTARDIALFSLSQEPEFVLPRNSKVLVGGFSGGWRQMFQVDDFEVKNNRKFTAKARDESNRAHLIKMLQRGGRENPEQILDETLAATKEAASKLAELRASGKPQSDQADTLLRRMSMTLTA